MKRLLILLGLAASAQAQIDHTFTIDQVASQFTWTGNTSIGPINGVPDNDFEISGTIDLGLWEGVAAPIDQGRFNGGDVVLPYIKGEIPNIFGPPLAVIELTGVRFTVTSPSFGVAADGSFTATVILTATQGTLIVTPLVGNPSNINLTGLSSDPTVINGTLDHNGGDLHLDAPISVQFSFVDPGSGISGDLTLDGSVIADWDCAGPSNYCVLSPNSAGPGAMMGATGSSSVFDNDLLLGVSGCPTGQYGLFFYGPNQIQVPGGDGTLCVGGSLVRLQIVQTDTFGTAFHALDLTNLPGGNQIQAGETQNFGFWFRDPPGGSAGYNFSDGLQVGFCL